MKARSFVALFSLCLALPACSAGTQVKGPARAPESFPALRDRVVDAWLADHPQSARQLGLHAFDGVVPDFRKAAIDARIARARKAREELAAVPPAGLSVDDSLDRALLLQELDLELFAVDEMHVFQKAPQTYGELFAVNNYLDRDYAPLEVRARKLLEHEKAALGQVAHAIANLSRPVPRPVLETGIKIYKGYVRYLREDVPKQLQKLTDVALLAEVTQTNEKLAREAEAMVERLRVDYLPSADQDYALGEAGFRKLLEVQEGIHLSLDEFLRIGEADLEANRRAYEALRSKVTPTRPLAEELLAEATKLVDAARAFVVEKGIVTIPSQEPILVKETPPFMRWNSAFQDAPGPFETARGPSFFYITMPDPSWPRAEQEAYLPQRGQLISITTHEVWPGHFLQGLWQNRAPTRVQKMFTSYSFREGWAHYGEQMMIDEGFAASEPEARLGQLADALLRDCRYVVAVGLHAKGMTVEQAAERFEKECFQDPATAREQAVRGTFDPGYFAYTLGKLQILALREEAKRRLGKRFSLRNFHDTLLAHGAPPIALVRERVLAEMEAIATKDSRRAAPCPSCGRPEPIPGSPITAFRRRSPMARLGPGSARTICARMNSGGI
ncbi:DUF885 domain-containing protein [Polyangium mundeleinium]|uniref:DUF885 domain-containing protein n=1 Tax=Polyangium mundeleinium TaxID=2995306 RepID=A0ABT5ENB4_9BACT|nr:DUF885 domain-containing protein [Polyangium mundeleinium]MDC0742829.1 DUF885 domain-containing protein [Polyangium mundeleinium]